MSLYSVVVPVYNSEHTLEELYRRLEKVFREVIKEDFELILVDDGSKDRSFEVMTELRNKDQRVRIIQMARNFGQHPALLCGFAHVRGDFVVTMDDDLQHQRRAADDPHEGLYRAGKRLTPAHGAESHHQTQRQRKQQGQSEQLTVEQKRAGKATQNHRHKNTPINPFFELLPSPSVTAPSMREPHAYRQQKASLTEGGGIAQR